MQFWQSEKFLQFAVSNYGQIAGEFFLRSKAGSNVGTGTESRDCRLYFMDMKIMLGTKIGMTRVFDEAGRNTPVTLVSAGPVTVIQARTKEKDGYEAVQVGFGERKAKRLSRAVRGHLNGLGNFRWLREFRITNQFTHSLRSGFPSQNRQDFVGESRIMELERGAKIEASVFKPGDIVKVAGISKGKGFAGVVKRHGFHGGPRSHGQKHSEREPGSISTGRIQSVRKGKRMAGRMGGERVTVQRLKIVGIDKENNMLAVKGAVPGRRGTLLEIRGQS